MRRGEHKCRILKIHPKLRDQKVKAILCVCVCVYIQYSYYIERDQQFKTILCVCVYVYI